MPTRPHSAPVKKNGNTINCVTLSIGVTQQNNFAQANIRRSHGGVRGQKRHPLSPYSYDKSSEYVHEIDQEAADYVYEDNDEVRSNISEYLKFDDDVNLSGQNYRRHSAVVATQLQYRTPSRLESKFNCSEYANLLASQLLKNGISNYRPFKCHQYLTLTELKDASAKDTNVKLGRPTRTTLLRARQMSSVHNIAKEQRNEEKQPKVFESEVLAERRKLAVEEIIDVSLPEGQSLHSFVVGARYNRAHYLDAKSVTEYGLYLPRHYPEMCFVTNKKLVADEDGTNSREEQDTNENDTGITNTQEHLAQTKRSNALIFPGDRPFSGNNRQAKQAWVEQDENHKHHKITKSDSLRVKGSGFQHDVMPLASSNTTIRQRRAQSAHPAFHTGSSQANRTVPYIPVHVQGMGLTVSTTLNKSQQVKEERINSLLSNKLLTESARSTDNGGVIAPVSSPRMILEQSSSVVFNFNENMARNPSDNVKSVNVPDETKKQLVDNVSIACTPGATPTIDLDSVSENESGNDNDHTIPAMIQVSVKSSEIGQTSHKESLPVLNQTQVPSHSAEVKTSKSVEKVDRCFNVPSVNGDEKDMNDVEDTQNVDRSEPSENKTNFSEKDANINEQLVSCTDEKATATISSHEGRPTSALSHKTLGQNRASSAKRVRFADEKEDSKLNEVTEFKGSKRPMSAKSGIVRNNVSNDVETFSISGQLMAQGVKKSVPSDKRTHNVHNLTEHDEKGLKWKDLRLLKTDSTSSQQNAATSSDSQNAMEASET